MEDSGLRNLTLAKNTCVRRARRRVYHGMGHLNLYRGLSHTQKVDGEGLITVTLPVMGKGLS